MAENRILEFIINFTVLLIRVSIAYLETIIVTLGGGRHKSIANQNVLITGAGQGLGRELAKKFAERGTNLALVDINKESNEQVKNEIHKLHSNNKSLKIKTYTLDITDEEKLSEFAKQVHRELGPIDILINNAGIVQCLPFLELSPKLVERTFKVNTFAHIWMIRNFLPSMLARKRGHIVAISSVAGLTGNRYLADYCASKYAVVGLMNALEVEYKDDENINFTTVCPASMSTGMFQSFTSKFPWLLPVIKPEEVAQATVDAVLANKHLVVVPQIALVLLKLSALIPRRVFRLLTEYFDYGVKPHNS